MTDARPFQDDEDVVRTASEIWQSLERDDWLEAFAAHLRQSVERLVEKLAEMGDRIGSEREAMEGAFRELAEGMAEAAREGGADLSRQLEQAMAWAETPQQVVEILNYVIKA